MKKIILLFLLLCSGLLNAQISLSEIQDTVGKGYVPITDYDPALATYIQKYMLLQDYLRDSIDWNIGTLDLNQVLTNGNDAGGLDALNFAEVEADEFIGDLRGAVLFKAQAGETLAKGDVVYVSGISGNTTIVSKADADDATKMPAFGVVAAAASSPNPVDIYTFGTLSNLNTSAYTLGDVLYVSTTAGQLTATPPTGESALLQNIAKVTRVDNSAGSIKISGAGRTNATPNLNTGRLFVGNASNQAVADGTMYVDIANSRVGIETNAPSSTLDIIGDIQVSDLPTDNDATEMVAWGVDGRLKSTTLYTHSRVGVRGVGADLNDMTDYSSVSSAEPDVNTPFGASWYNLINIRHRGGILDGYKYGGQIAFGMLNYRDRIAFRAESNGTWDSWKELYHTDNITDVDISTLDLTNYWQKSGSDLYYNTGNIGIGVTPSSKLDVVGEFQLDNATNGANRVLIDSDGSGNTEFVDLSTLSGGTDDQTLSLVTNTLSIEDGNSVDLSGYLDNTDSQTLSFTSPNLSISGGNSVDISAIDTDTQLTQEEVEDYAFDALRHGTGTQTLITVTYDDANNNVDYVVNDDLSLYDNTTSGFLSAEVDGSTTNELQDLSWDNVTNTIEITNGTNAVITGFLESEVDGSITNELQDFDVSQLVGTDLQLSLTQDADVYTIDLSSLDDSGTDDQTLQEVMAQGNSSSIHLNLTASTTEAQRIEVGLGRTGNGYAFIDLIGDATYSDYGLRIIRNNNGANASSIITHRGSDALILRTEDANSSIKFQPNGASSKGIVTSSGDWGFGMTTPNRTVEITNTGSAYEPALEINSNSDLNNYARLDLTNVNAPTGGFIFYQDNGGKAGIRNLSTDRITYVVDNSSSFHAWEIGAGTERMRLNSTGLGIGTTSPAEDLEVEGGFEIDRDGISRVHMGFGDQINTYPSITNVGAADFFMGGAVSHDFMIGTRGNGSGEGLHIGSFNGTAFTSQMLVETISGNVGIGTSSPAKQLEIENTGADATMLIQTTDDYNAYIEYQNNSGGGGLNYRTGVTTSEHWDISSSGQTMLRLDRATLQNTSFVDFNVTDGSTSMQLNEDGLYTTDGVLNFVNTTGAYTTTYTTGSTAAAFSGQTTISGFDYFLLNGGTLEAAKDQDYFEIKYQDHDGATHSSFTWDAEWRFYEDGYFHTGAGIVHLNDEDTFFKFTTNKIQTYAGNSTHPKATYNASGVTFNENTILSNDFRVNGTVSYMIFGDAGLNRVGIFNGSPSAELDVVGDTELNGDLEVNGEVTWSERALGEMYRLAEQSVTNGNTDKIDFATQVYQDGDITTDVTTNDRITVTNAGKYTIHLSALMSNDGTGSDSGRLLIYKNGTQIADSEFSNVQHVGLDSVTKSISGILNLAASDYLEVYLQELSGTGDAEAARVRFTVKKEIGY